MIASAKQGEGKTTTASNLAVTYAQEGKKVLLVDTNLRKPSLHQVFNQLNRVGLTSFLLSKQHLAEIIIETNIENLSLITSGPLPPNPTDILGSNRMLQLIEDLKGMFDVIIFDTPPLLEVTDGSIISAMSDGVVLVVQSNNVKRDMVEKVKMNLEYVRAKILGVVLNNKKIHGKAVLQQ